MDNKKRLKWARHSNPLQASAMFLPSPVLTDRFKESGFNLLNRNPSGHSPGHAVPLRCFLLSFIDLFSLA